VDHLTETLSSTSSFPHLTDVRAPSNEPLFARTGSESHIIRMEDKSREDSTIDLGGSGEGTNDRPYNFFAFDGMTERQTEHRGNFRPDAEVNFNAAINWARDLFSERPQVSKLVLRNHSGTILCKKNFGKESFFQSSTSKLEDIELISRDYISADYNTTFM